MLPGYLETCDLFRSLNRTGNEPGFLTPTRAAGPQSLSQRLLIGSYCPVTGQHPEASLVVSTRGARVLTGTKRVETRGATDHQDIPYTTKNY